MMGNRNHVVRETRSAKTLFIITAASLLTWLPFQILNVLLYFGVIRNFPYINITTRIIKVFAIQQLACKRNNLSIQNIRI